MVAPKVRKAITVLVAFFSACLLGGIVLSYLLFFSPSALSRRTEQSADNLFSKAKETVSNLSRIAEIDEKVKGLKRASEYQKSDGKNALAASIEAKEKYKELLKNAEKLEQKNSLRDKIKASKYMVKAARNYQDWIDESLKAMTTLKYTTDALKKQANGLYLLNKAISKINAGNNIEALKINDKAIRDFNRSTTSIKKAQKSLKNKDIAQLQRMIDLYLKASKAIETMANTLNDTEKYNAEAEKLNKTLQKASEIASNNGIAKNLNQWLEDNFYYEAGKLIFNYKKGVESWPAT